MPEGSDQTEEPSALSYGAPSFGDLSFEELVDRLEALAAQLADGALGIERAAEFYEQAQLLHAAAAARLEAVVRRIDSL